MTNQEEFSYEEIIEMIEIFYTGIQSYSYQQLNTKPAIKKLMNVKGMLENSAEYPQLLVLTEKGRDFFHSQIEEITNQFLDYSKKNSYIVKRDDAIAWYTNEYGISGKYYAEFITDYICDNLRNYGYFTSKCHNNNDGWYYIIESHKE